MKVTEYAVSHLRDVERTLNSESAVRLTASYYWFHHKKLSHIVCPSSISQELTECEESSPMIPATSGQFRSLFEYLETYNAASKTAKSVLLHVGCGDGRVGVTATRFGLCSETIGIDASPLRVHTAIKLAFQQQVLSKCHFFQAKMFEDPSLLLGKPNLLSEKIWDADVVFLHAFPSVLKKLTPLLAKLSDDNYEYMLGKQEKKKRKFVTLMYHLPADVTVNPRFIQGTDLCVYDGIVDKPVARKVTPPPSPQRM